jgi:hypothetical protein
MGGSVIGAGNCTLASEFNAFADPEAARVIFDNVPSGLMTVLPWEVCHDHALSWEEYDVVTKGALEVLPDDVDIPKDGAASQDGPRTAQRVPEGVPLFKYFMKRVTKDYERYVSCICGVPMIISLKSILLFVPVSPSLSLARGHIVDYAYVQPHASFAPQSSHQVSVNDPHRYTNAQFPYAPADAFAMAALLHPELLVEVMERHCIIETQGTVTRGFLAVDWYHTKDALHKVKLVRKLDGEAFRKVIFAAAGIQ